MSNETNNQPPKQQRRGPMGGPHGPRGPVEKAKDVKGTSIKLGRLLSKYKLALIIVFIFAIHKQADYGTDNNDIQSR